MSPRRRTPRVLAVVRQSAKRLASESPESQLHAIRAWAQAEGAVIVAEAVDRGVSAKVSPFDRPSLGPWLTDADRLAEWDTLVVWKVDRLVRSTRHFYAEVVPRLVDDLGKRVVACSEGVDTGTTSALELSIRVAMAQEELAKVTDRARAHRAAQRRGGRWGSGRPPFGYTSQAGRASVVPEDQAVILRIFDMLEADYNPHHIAAVFNREGVLTPRDRHEIRQGRPARGGEWNRSVVVGIVRSRHLLGESSHKGEVIRDDDGRPVMLGEPLVDRARWDRAQERVVSGRRHARRSNGSLLLGVVFCNYCGRKMYMQGQKYYRCRSQVGTAAPHCGAPVYPAGLLEDAVTRIFLEVYGDQEVVERRAVALVDYGSRLAEIAEQEANLADSLALVPKGTARDRVVANLNRLAAERAELEEAQAVAQGVEEVRTGRTYRDEWDAAESVDDKGTLLRKHGVIVMAQRKHFRAPAGVPRFGDYLSVEVEV